MQYWNGIKPGTKSFVHLLGLSSELPHYHNLSIRAIPLEVPLLALQACGLAL